MAKTFEELSKTIKVEKPGRTVAMNAITFSGDICEIHKRGGGRTGEGKRV